MRNPINRKIIALSLLAGLGGCVDDEGDPEPISSGVIVELRDNLSVATRTITLMAETEKIYPCGNYSIDVSSETTDGRHKLTFKGVPDISFCQTSVEPARTYIALGSPSNGEYWIELNNGHLRNKGFLLISDTEITLRFGPLRGIEFRRTTLKRVPPNTYWGTIIYKQRSNTLVTEFIQKLADLGAEFNKQPPGDYWYYNIDSNGEIVDPENTGPYSMNSVIFQYDGDEQTLAELIASGGGTINKLDVSLSFTSYKGQRINNY